MQAAGLNTHNLCSAWRNLIRNVRMAILTCVQSSNLIPGIGAVLILLLIVKGCQ